MAAEKAQITVIGGGVGGYTAAVCAARMGGSVTLIEKDELGGVCLNRGCIPTKSLLQSTQVIKSVKSAEIFGITCENCRVDFGAIINRKNSIISQLRDGIKKLLAAKRVKIIKGTATLLDCSTVGVSETEEKIKSGKIIIATGSRPIKPSIDGAEEPGVLDSDKFLEMKRLPKSIAIIGGGYIGVEFAQILIRLGVDVTLLESMKNLIPRADKEIALALEQSMVKEGVKIFTNTNVEKIVHDKARYTITFTVEDKTLKCGVEKVLFSVGRKPDLKILNVDKVGLAHQDDTISVNGHLETNIPGIYAVGDVVGGIMLAHKAMAEAECAAKNAIGYSTAMNYRAIPSCIYTSPEVASVGMSEELAREKFDIRVGRFTFQGCGKAAVLDETYGMVKIVVENKYGEVLGVHIIGPHATELIAEAVLGMSMEMTVEELAKAVHPHPTLSESIRESALSLCGGAIHMP